MKSKLMNMITEFLLIYVMIYWMKMYKILLNWVMMLMLLSTMLNMNLESFYFNYLNENMSNWLSILTMWIILICLMMISNNKFNKMFYFNMLFTLMILLTYFNIKSIMIIYLTFESSILPIMIFMLWKSNSIDRLNSFMYMLIFMLIFSLPSIMFLIFIPIYMNLNFMNLFLIYQFSYYPFIIISMIMVKMPVFLLHIWLPKAHGDSPIYSSMILASIMLKMAGYLALIFKPIIIYMLKEFIIINWINLMILFILFTSMITLIQIDFKILIAYSSIVHMTMSFLSIIIFNQLSELGMLFMMFSHGLISSGLFYFHNLFYKRMNSRSMFLIKNLNSIFKSIIPLWFFMCMSNLGFPSSLNMISEILIIMNLFNLINLLYLIILILSMLMSSIYSLYLFTYCMHGKNIFNSIKLMNFISLKEMYLIYLHLIPLYMFIFKLEILY
uniref:NADH-ubiquinone oxidoreductase chain 4 n=1 Tax=Cephalonomia gallicola TaxID=627714 RepID=E0WCF1_9HYME|nr:NADH dehydrogenase subunit 4 [Cephalonomia gallicola]